MLVNRLARSRRRFLRLLAASLAGLGALWTSPGGVRASVPTRRGRLVRQDAPPELRFDADRAFRQLVAQVDLGPRVPNTPGHAACRDYLLRELGAAADQVLVQDFVEEIRGTALQLTNIIGVFGPDQPTKVLLAAHWDTRPTADMDPNPANRSQPIAGANDGASGVAVLLEVARVLREVGPPLGVVIVFFDGEDYGPGIDAMFLGSRYYARHPVPERPAWGILLDMVGDRDLQIPREGYSERFARPVNDRVWAAARELGRPEFPDTVGQAILDDHVPLLEVGVPMIDLIDFSYGPANSWWHTLEDTPDKCSPASLQAVGQVVLRTLYNAREAG
jgi:glutaminyl-peptide cyclotransferase